MDLFSILYFVIKDYKTLIKEIKKIKYYFLNKNKTKINNIETNHIKKNIKQKMKKGVLTNNIKDKKLSQKILDNKKLKNNRKKLALLLNKETITSQLNNQKIKLKKSNKKISKRIIGLPKKSIIKGKNFVSNNNKSYNFFIMNNNINLGKKSTKIIKSIPFIKLNYNEMNSLSFKDAIIKDKRNCIQYYISLMKTKHSLIYIFYNEDYNSKIAKISVQIFDLATLIAINALFFHDSTMHKIYTDHGAFDFVYQLPQIIYSTIISFVLNWLIQLLGLTEDNILSFKNDKYPLQNLNQKYNKLITIIKIKLTFFYILNISILVVYWYYVTCFCGIYRNTQIHLLKDSLYSYIFSLITPFVIYIFPSIFRVLALRRKSKILYILSKLLQML